MGDRGQFMKEVIGYFYEYYFKKYFNNKSEEVLFGDLNLNGGINDRVICYVDVLFMYVEVVFYIGNEVEVRNLFNLVCKRVNLEVIM